ncbi:uncharacterized protein OCT59_025764 [Rhizophagus irregularis]|uniref:Rox1p n=1 Tax=Rhizophagus irregularis (strain DAOM 197198w) TaxID=1432141 RepID=A0A015JN96_RHIIW|nr:Rox1p [Rhizophagus irregularis DAOM 197198w]UZO05414.1 hypothetical protein OCT59_025764 [Rhizophagus irregularis]GBC11059.1 mating-type MAT1-1-3 [Rhizophagus irregularis DAOM 181602=DAOM 197198]CAG8674460.1 9948_t:CDS:1 [Rhizophagus irregularis]
MLTKTKKNLGIDKIKKLQSLVRDQTNSINLNELDTNIKPLIIELINDYSDIKTILNLQELLSPSNTTRSKTIPRPQNPWVLYRKNISKGLIGLKMSVGDTSAIASCLWEKVTKRESQFWTRLFQITKKIHLIEYPNYKYSPVRSLYRNKIANNTNKRNLLNNVLDDSVTTHSLEIKSNNIGKNNNMPNTSFNIPEIDVDMTSQCDFMEIDRNTSLFMDQTYISSLYTDPYLIDPSLINTSFSFVDDFLPYYTLDFNIDSSCN